MPYTVVARSGLIAGVIGVGARDDALGRVLAHESLALKQVSPYILLLCDKSCLRELEGSCHDGESPIYIIKGRPFDEADQLLCSHYHNPPRQIDLALDGRYLVAEFSGRHVNVRTDRINSIPIYYCVLKETVYFASELLLLTLMVPCRFLPNYQAIAEYAVGGIQTSRQSVFQNVQRSLGGEKICFSIREEDPTPTVTVTKVNPLSSLVDREVDNLDEDYLVHNIDRCVARENYDESSLLLLTSGRDSLSIALAEGAPKASTTFGEYWSNDRVRGTHRSKRLGHKIVGTALPNWRYGDFGDFIAIRHGGPPGFQAAHLLYGFSQMPNRYNLIVAGYSGNSISHDLFGSLGEPFDNKVHRYFCARHADLKRAGIQHEEVEDAVARVKEMANALRRDIEPMRAFAMLDAEWRQGSFIATTFDACDTIIPISTPLFADCFFLYALNAPEELLLRGKGWSEAMRRLRKRAGIKEPKWLSALYTIEQKIKAFRCGRHELNQVDYGLVGKRSEDIDIEQFMCGYPKLDNYVRMLWADRASREPLGFPTFTWLASISLAFRLAGDKTILDRRLFRRTSDTSRERG